MLNLELHTAIDLGNIVFKPYPEIRETLKQIEKDKMPRVTAYAEFSYDVASETRDVLFNEAEGIIIPYDWLWSFVQNRTVSHWGISVSKIEDNVSTYIGTNWRPIMIESVYGVPIIRFYQLEKFFRTAISKMKSNVFVNQTNLVLSLHLYLDATQGGLTEITFLKNWLALETLVNAHSDLHENEFILRSNEFKRFRKHIESVVQEYGELDVDKRTYLIGNLPGLRRYPVRKSIDDFFSNYKINYDVLDIMEIKKIRDHITHAGKLPIGIDLNAVINYERKLRVLLQRSYLTLLGCSFTYSIDDRGFIQVELT